MASVAQSELLAANDNRSDPDVDALARVAALAGESLDLERVLPKTLVGIAEFLPADHVVVLRDEGTASFVGACASVDPASVRCGEIYAKRALVENNASAHYRFHSDGGERARRILPYLGAGAGAALTIPLCVDGVSLGRLDIVRDVHRPDFSERERRFAEACAKVLSLTIRNGTEYARVAWLAEHDPLTALGNRRQFDLALARELARAERYNRNLSLLLIDIDDFKAVNSRFGLSGGDEILRRIGHVLASSARQDLDIPCRIGGDEFAMILPEIDENSADDLAQRLLREVGKATAPILAVQFSYSVSTYPHIEVDQLRGHADSRLLDAKTQKGRCAGPILTVVQ